MPSEVTIEINPAVNNATQTWPMNYKSLKHSAAECQI